VSENPNFPVMQILSARGPVMIANVQGAANPVAIIDDSILDLLAAQCRSAKDEALANPGNANVGAVMALCATLSSVLDEYKGVRNKFYDGIGGEQQKAAMLREFDQLMKAFDRR
jgi:hypothetical protein